MLCASFVVQSISERLLYVNASVSQVSVCNNFLRPMVFLCKRLLSDSRSFLACRTAKMTWDELQGDEKGWSVLGWDEKYLTRTYLDDIWEEMRWEEMSWDKVRRAQMRWSVECEECSEKCEGRSGASNVTCATGHHFCRVHARTGLAGARRMQVL